MTGWLLDTNVVSELRRRRPHRGVKAWADAQAPEHLHLSAVTLAELRFGIERQPDAAFRAELETWLDRGLRPWFAGRILPLSEDVVLEWRRMVARGRERNVTFSQPDLFIAATARLHVLTVCTRNEHDFRLADVPVLNPWSG